jgi:hypothetical protein
MGDATVAVLRCCTTGYPSGATISAFSPSWPSSCRSVVGPDARRCGAEGGPRWASAKLLVVWRLGASPGVHTALLQQTDLRPLRPEPAQDYDQRHKCLLYAAAVPRACCHERQVARRWGYRGDLVGWPSCRFAQLIVLDTRNQCEMGLDDVTVGHHPCRKQRRWREPIHGFARPARWVVILTVDMGQRFDARLKVGSLTKAHFHCRSVSHRAESCRRLCWVLPYQGCPSAVAGAGRPRRTSGTVQS